MSLREDQIYRLIEKRYPAPEYATLCHVRNQTGHRRTTRTADAMVMSLYPSRGLELMGFEIKCSRTDWMREKKDPAKAEEISRFCDRWWIVAAADTVVPEDELPPTWGLLVAQSSRLVAKVVAPKLTAQPLGREMLAGLLRNVTERWIRRASVVEEINDARAAGVVAGEARVERETQGLKRQLDALTATVDEFETASGLSIRSRWDRGKVAAAVNYLMRCKPEDILCDLGGLKHSAERIAAQIGEALKEVQAFQTAGGASGQT